MPIDALQLKLSLKIKRLMTSRTLPEKEISLIILKDHYEGKNLKTGLFSIPVTERRSLTLLWLNCKTLLRTIMPHSARDQRLSRLMEEIMILETGLQLLKMPIKRRN